MNEWINEWMNKLIWIDGWILEWMNEEDPGRLRALDPG